MESIKKGVGMANTLKTLDLDLDVDTGDAISKGALYFQFAYSIIGLLVTVLCFAIGLLLFVQGLGGESTVLIKGSGYELSITKAAPGTIVLLAGIAVCWVTKYNVVIHKK